MEDKRWLLFVAGALLLGMVWVYFPWPERPPGAPKFPVTGTVLVNGEPAGGLTVRLFAKDTSLDMQDQVPVASTDKEGHFELSSFNANDGAAEGEYVATFYWPTNLLSPTKDRFKGKFLNPQTSTFSVTIPAEPTELPPFKIEVPKRDLLPMELGLAELEQLAKSKTAQ
ncbi:hypothetical protein Pan216_28290 [Planctomycetes bacterium Pan216]|uniref:Nickel uptake substrate-specific transmembrane region n=1 Tax=Kolteria novifilia TaxID=2527975 RepID=A0A518B4Q8_9BACT|nr:hypothetical protein Pan216_28290 [Planctomycetes bacterium Pan216]